MSLGGSEIARLCGLNAGLSRKLAKANDPTERAAIKAEMEANREKMSAVGRRTAGIDRQHAAEARDEAEEEARRARRREEGYW